MDPDFSTETGSVSLTESALRTEWEEQDSEKKLPKWMRYMPHIRNPLTFAMKSNSYANSNAKGNVYKVTSKSVVKSQITTKRIRHSEFAVSTAAVPSRRPSLYTEALSKAARATKCGSHAIDDLVKEQDDPKIGEFMSESQLDCEKNANTRVGWVASAQSCEALGVAARKFAIRRRYGFDYGRSSVDEAAQLLSFSKLS